MGWYLDYIIEKDERDSNQGDNMSKRYKQPFRRKTDQEPIDSLAHHIVEEQMKILRQAVDNAFKLKLDVSKLKRAKKKKAA
jgi:hypothetical protein